MLLELVRGLKGQNLFLRIGSAIILAPLAILAVTEGSWAFLVTLSVATALLAIEWGLMCCPRTPGRMACALTLGVLCALFAATLDQVSASFLLLVFGAAAAGLYARALKAHPLDAAYGVLYIGWPVVVMQLLRQSEHGLAWTFLVLVVTWSADSAAFLVGSSLKGPKLWPRFSPNKTWTGFIGGLLAGAIGAAILCSVYHLTPNLWIGAGVGFVGALATMAGDLWESALKRRYGVKDSGRLIPGHGGLLDRVDGMMFAVVALAICRTLLSFGGY